MVDRPILFSGPMVRALLDGRKTQTRRIIDFPGVERVLDFVKVATDAEGRSVYEMKDAAGQFVTRPAGKGLVDYHFAPRIAVRDRLWVREAWRVEARLDRVAPRDIKTNYPGLRYLATDQDFFGIEGKTRPGMFMPRWASRLTLIVTDVRIERLQDISHQDAVAEGLVKLPASGRYAVAKGDQYFGSASHNAREVYSWLWDSINGPGAWDANPWVAAYTFDVERSNIDASTAKGND